MFKIMIVDDEMIILNGIRMMIENCRELSFPIDIATASNVPAAIETLSRFQPDLLLVDITMPVMDGFDLIRYVRAHSFEMDIVILTSHASFDYAREAISLQIRDYLLKPVNTSSLMDTIRSSWESRAERREALKKQALLSLRAMMLYDIPFSDLMLGSDLIRELFPHPYFTVVVLEPGRSFPACAPEELLELFSAFYDVCLPMQFARRGEYIYLCNHSLFSVRTKALAGQLADRLSSGDYQLGISISSNSCENLHQLYQNAIQRIFYQKVCPGSPALAGAALFTYQDCVNIFLQTPPEKTARELENYMEKLAGLTSSLSDRSILEQTWNSFYINIRFYLDSLSLCPELPMQLPLPDEIRDSSSFIAFTADWLARLKQELSRQEKEADDNDCIPRLIRYIKANYQRDLSLNDLAEEVDLNPNYLSGLFKKATSCSYLQYLHHERLQTAKQLLLSTDLNMEQIAARVGYNSSVQLLRIFKKYEGMSPSDYRNGKHPEAHHGAPAGNETARERRPAQ